MKTSVKPFTAAQSSGPNHSTIACALRSNLRLGLSQFKRAWFAAQVSHRGKYSIERLLALEDYTRRTSVVRVILVCVGTPLPVVLLVVFQKTLPLENPADGWRANWGFWIRAALLAGSTSLGIFSQLKHMIGIDISLSQLTLQLIFMAVSYTVVSIWIASTWIFPIPFMIIVMVAPFMTLLVGSMLVILGPSKFHSILAKRDHLRCFTNSVNVQVLMAVIYPAYQLLFKTVTGTYYELPVFLLLPVIKLVLKNLVAFCLEDLVDLIPENIIFTVHFFNAVYLATCMQSASSTSAIATVMIIDIVETGLTILSIYRSSTRIMHQLHEMMGPSRNVTPATLLDAAHSLCFYHDKFTKEERSQVQVRSCLSYKITPETNHIVDNLDKTTLSLGPTFRRASNTQSMPTIKRMTSSFPNLPALRLLFSHQKIQSIAPVQAVHVKLAHTARSRNLSAIATVPSVLHIVTLRTTLATLFTIECMVMAEYIEFVIPLLYGHYILMMVHLPSAQYHTELTGVTEANVGPTVQTVIIYALLELASFILLVLLLRKSCGIKALYHLAFVLENQTLSVQSKIMGWMLMTLGFRVVHFGLDFTFQFAWIRDQNN